MDRILKYHIGFSIFFIVVTAIVLFLAYLTAGSLYFGIEGLLIGDVGYFAASLFMAIMFGFVMVIVGYQVLYQFTMVYLDERILKVPEDCPKCEEKLDTECVKWIEEDKRAECPNCGEELKVTKVWE